MQKVAGSHRYRPDLSLSRYVRTEHDRSSSRFTSQYSLRRLQLTLSRQEHSRNKFDRASLAEGRGISNGNNSRPLNSTAERTNSSIPLVGNTESYIPF